MRFDGLIGAVGQSLIPEWMFDWLNSSIEGRLMMSNHRNLFEATNSQPCLPSECGPACQSIGELIAEFTPGLLDGPVGGSRHEDFDRWTVRSIPVLQSTLAKSQKLDGVLSGSLAMLGSTSIRELQTLGFSWLEIFDLAQCIAVWVPAEFEESGLQGWGYDLSLADDSNLTFDAATFEGLARGFLSELIFLDGGRIRFDQVDLFLGRFGWGKEPQTLDSIGEQMGVTRERVRQIVNRLLTNGAERRWPIGGAVRENIASLIECGTFDEFDGFLGSWSLNSLTDLFERLGALEIAEEIRSKVMETFKVPKELEKAIRSTRLKLGFLSMQQLETNTNHLFSRDYLEKAVRSVYSSTSFFDDWALAGTAHDTQTQNAISIQFAMNEVISVPELLEGVKRVQAGRADGSPLPDLPTFRGLLVSSGLIDDSTGRYLGPEYRFENNGTGFIHVVIRNAPGQIMHIDQLSESLAELGVKPTTTAHYASYQAGLRRTADGELVYAAGASLDPEDIRATRIHGELIDQPSEILFTFRNGEIVFHVQLGTALLYRGAFTIPAAARALLENSYAVECDCGERFTSSARVSAGNQWNLSYLTNHLCVDHGIRPGRRIELLTQNGRLVASL